jgi:hypothetical protein
MDKVGSDLCVVRIFLGNVIAFVMRFLAVDQMMMKSKPIVGLDRILVHRPVTAQVVINVGSVMVDNDNHAGDGIGFGRFIKQTGFFQKFALSGDFFDFKIVGAGPFEESLFGANNESELVVPVGQHFADLSNQVDHCAPTQIARQLAADETFKKLLMVVTNLFIHPGSMPPGSEECCSGLLTSACCA